MSRDRTFETAMSIFIAEGDEWDFDLVITYQMHDGCAQSHEDPGEAAHVEIIDARMKDGTPLPKWLEDRITADETLAVNVLCHAIEIDQADEDAAAEHRADQHRDDLMERRS
jgi:hypothetical protein